MRLFWMASGLFFVTACSQANTGSETGETGHDHDDTGEADTDTDTDSDTDTDTDADTDADGVLINELLASNDTINDDEDGDFDDWLELYNPGSAAVDLSNWSIGDSDVAEAYALPAGTTIDAGGYLLIWCDDDGAGLHTNFKLTSGGETVSLWDGSGNEADVVTFPEQTTDESYGRETDGSPTWVTFDTPTPGAAN